MTSFHVVWGCSLQNAFVRWYAASPIDVLYCGVEEHRVVAQLLDRLVFGILEDIVDGCLDVFQADAVFNGFSHKSVFCHGLHSQRQMATVFRPQ